MNDRLNKMENGKMKMENRFKFRAVLHQNKYEEYQLEKFLHQRIFDVMRINLGIEDLTVEIIAEYPNGDWAIREIDETDVDLIQCTGLKDKTGTLIYEGDILKETYNLKNEEKENIVLVKWANKSASFVMLHTWNNEDYSYFYDLDVNLTNFEIIGNMYDNSELLSH